MKLTVGSGFDKLSGLVDQFVGMDKGLSKALEGCELSIGKQLTRDLVFLHTLQTVHCSWVIQLLWEIKSSAQLQKPC